MAVISKLRKRSKNLINKENSEKDYYINPSGNKVSSSGYGLSVTEKIYVKSSTYYTYSGMGDVASSSVSRTGYQYDSDNNPIKSIQSSTGVKVTFLTEPNCAYVLLQYVNTAEQPMLEVGSIGTNPIEYKPYYLDITKYDNSTIKNINFNGVDYHFAKANEVVDDVCENAVSEPIIDMQISGNSRQGKNIVKYPYDSESGIVSNGITYIINSDGSITVNGTATENSYFQINTITFEANKTYTIYHSPEGSSSDKYYFFVNGIVSVYDTDKTTTLTEEKTGAYYILVKQGITVENLTFYPMIVEGTNITEYENPIISPTNPIEVQSVGERTKNLLHIKSRSLGTFTSSGDNTQKRTFEFDKYYIGMTSNNYYYPYVVKSYSVNGDIVTLTVTSGGYGIGIPVKVKPNTDYVISVKYGHMMAVAFYSNDGTWLSNKQSVTGVLTFKTPENCDVALVVLRPEIEIETTYENIQLEEGTTATDYEPYGYKVPLKISGKNLYNPATDTRFTLQEDGSYLSNTFIDTSVNILGSEKLPIGIYTISLKLKSPADKNYRLRVYYTDGTYTDSYKPSTSEYIDISLTTRKLEIEKIAWQYSASSDQVQFKELQLEESDVATDYEPYIEPTTTNIYLSEPLRKIGDYADYIDYKNKKIVRKITTRVFNGAETFNTIPSQPYPYTYYTIGKSGLVIDDLCICTHLEHQANFSYTRAGNNKFRVFNSPSNNASRFGFRFYIDNAIVYKGDEVKALLTEYYNAGNPMIVYYAHANGLETEETIELPEIATLDGTTTIFDIQTTIEPSEVKVNYWKQI